MAFTFTKVPAWQGTIHQGCLNCPPVESIAQMDMLIAVGFGDARITKDGETIYQEPYNIEDESNFHTLAEFEEMAKADPDHDWRAILIAPLRDREYQRHEEGKWVLIKSGMGFA
jgi:hypothetical protein